MLIQMPQMDACMLLEDALWQHGSDYREDHAIVVRFPDSGCRSCGMPTVRCHPPGGPRTVRCFSCGWWADDKEI